MTQAIRIALVVAFVNSFLILFFAAGYYPTAKVYLSVAALTFALCLFCIPLFAVAARIKTRGHYLFLSLIALLIFGPALLVVNANFESLKPEQLILPILGGIITFLFVIVQPKKS